MNVIDWIHEYQGRRRRFYLCLWSLIILFVLRSISDGSAAFWIFAIFVFVVPILGWIFVWWYED